MAAQLESRLRAGQRVELLAIGVERIVADLAAAEFITAGPTSRLPVFDGTELSVTFLRTAIGPNTRPGLELVRIAETAGERGLMTVRTRARFLPIGRDGVDVQPAPTDPVVLVRAPYRVTFSYAGVDRVWRNVWRGQGELPKAIRVQLRDAATDRTLAASTATIVNADMPADCVLSEVIADCLNRPPRRNRGQADDRAHGPTFARRDPPMTASSSLRCCGSSPRSQRSRPSSPCTDQCGDRVHGA
jgi:general secretion pathway protein J